ncbi:MAG: ferrous iron transport protein B [Cytophagales bacterium]|nr:ferrous iron transport protein B [Cytophagales bacterium]
MNQLPHIALVGNPNSGKSSLFNQLTGLKQKVGNFPGVTVDKKTGLCRLDDTLTAEIIDLPGTYSLYPKSPDERVVTDVLLNPNGPLRPDVVVVVVDAANLNRNLLLYTEVKDLGLPVVLVLNMLDMAEDQGLRINQVVLGRRLHAPVVGINARTGKGIDLLKTQLARTLAAQTVPSETAGGGAGPDESSEPFHFVEAAGYAPELVERIRGRFGIDNDYAAYQYAHQGEAAAFLKGDDRQQLGRWREELGFEDKSLQARETVARYETIRRIVDEAVQRRPAPENTETVSGRLDKILLHRYWGVAVFMAILFLIFQAIFAWAQVPADLIDGAIAALTGWMHDTLPQSQLVDLLTDGLVAGLGGILIFIPQIAVLFAFIAILEESGYMARVVFLMDRLMRTFGLNGRSVVPLISGVACAVPAIMATRTIDNRKERLITILVTPLMSCSARIPIYTILIGLVVPEVTLLGVLNLQGVALMALYLLGFAAALLSAVVMKWVMKTKDRSFLIMELPDYRMPRWGNVGITILEKVRAFVFEAGKVIIAISIILWVLSSYGPGKGMEAAAERAARTYATADESTRENRVASARLEASYAGHFGKFIEPAIRPLGYDWKIGIALLSSFAAREVFVGTLSTIYSIGSSDDDADTIRERLQQETNPRTGGPMYTPATAFSLLIFYAFAMMCMSTLAVVHRETRGWTWPAIQFFYMTALAYGSAWLVYTVLK